jgi:hypothetical protein
VCSEQEERMPKVTKKILQLLPADGWRVFTAYIGGDGKAVFEEAQVIAWALVERVYQDDEIEQSTELVVFDADSCGDGILLSDFKQYHGFKDNLVSLISPPRLLKGPNEDEIHALKMQAYDKKQKGREAA